MILLNVLKYSNNQMLIILLIFLSANIFAQDFEIKSLQTYANGNQTKLPVLNINDTRNSKLTIEFDILSNDQPFLSIVFRFCDRNWNPYNNIFLSNQGYNIDYSVNFERLPHTIKKASYHFKESYPSSSITFPYSGKWMYFITDSQDTSIVYDWGKFYVVNSEVRLNPNIYTSRISDDRKYPNALGRSFSLETQFYLPDSFYNTNIAEVEVIQNKLVSYPIVITKELYNDERFYEWNGSNNFTFIARNLLPGNEYRTVDIRDRLRFPNLYANANIDRVSISRYNQYGLRDIDGGSKINNPFDDYSNYLDVTFNLRLPSDFNKQVFLVGDFTDWEIWSGYELTNNKGLYEIIVELKRGIYDYQYVTVNNLKEDWIELEGNFWETNNIYNIFLYYNDPNFGGYDRIIGHTIITSGGI